MVGEEELPKGKQGAISKGNVYGREEVQTTNIHHDEDTEYLLGT